ncbi:MAG: NAD-dependent deacylase [Cyclobacteriaceae bacterium]|nr:NAD-dependent deacylase [Cyclobacteriaceae bacterium]
MKKIVILSGAGVSAESGIKTFRDSGGLWEGYDVMDVASPEGWARDKNMVLNFYNERRKNALAAQPNEGHKIIAALEQYFKVTVVTQNVDNLHEKAGSTHVIHLHGELFKSQSTIDPGLIYDIEGWELNEGDTCEKGSQLRPHIVWFGELVPMMTKAVEETISADIFIVIGTSLQVYPAAGLLEYVPSTKPKFIIDPKMPVLPFRPHLTLIEEVGSVGMSKVRDILLEEYR